MPFAGRPILGIVGGIGSGKSFVARVLGELGCAVIDSDAIAHAVYARPDVRRELAAWLGEAVLRPDGGVDRRAIARRVFDSPTERARLEALLHPLINAERERQMVERAADPSVRAFIWDSPLLIEAGLHTQCDAVLFVDTPLVERERRVRESRGWDAAELARREASQLPLEQKRAKASVLLKGDDSPELLQAAVTKALAAILARTVPSPSGRGAG